MENNKKILVPTIVAVATLVLLVFGATYAYFTVGSTNNFGTKELSATVEDVAGSVVLEQLQNTLSLDVTRAMMNPYINYDYGDFINNINYYASGSSTPANIAKMSVMGEGTYKCDYKITVTNSASSEENDLYKAILENSTEAMDGGFYVHDYNYEFVEPDLFPIEYKSTMYNITQKNPKYITANIFLQNDRYEQNYLKGKDITLTYSISDFECELWEPSEEFTELTFNYEYMDDIGYTWYFDYESGGPRLLSDKLVIPETFKGVDELSYRVVAIESFAEGFLGDVKTIELPSSVKKIGDWGLEGIGVEKLKLPKQVDSVGKLFLEGSYVEELYLPKSLNNILARALEGAYDLKDVYYEGTEAEWNELFKDYVGEGKEFDSVICYLYGVDSEEELEEFYGYSIPTIHFNVSY